jgi:hypothetical protein
VLGVQLLALAQLCRLALDQGVGAGQPEPGEPRAQGALGRLAPMWPCASPR